MSRISIDNYEAWFLDFFEGRLDAAQIDEMFQFLERYPKLKAELKDFEIIPIQPEPTPFDEKAFLKGEEHKLLEDPNLKLTPNQNIRFDNKHLLKKPKVSEEDIFAVAEGEITGVQAEELKTIIASDKILFHQFNAYQNSRLVPDNAIIYPHKAQLKKDAAIIPLFMRYASAAAVITGLTVAIWWYNQPKDNAPVVVEMPADKLNNDSSVIEQENYSTQLAEIEIPASTEITIENEASNAPIKIEKPITPQKTIKTIPAVVPNKKLNDIAVNERIIKVSYKNEIQEVEEYISMKEINQEDDLAENKTLIENDNSVESSLESPTQKTPVKSSSDISKALGYLAKTATEKITEASGDRMALQRKKSSEGEILTSTFKLGAFELTRSRSPK